MKPIRIRAVPTLISFAIVGLMAAFVPLPMFETVQVLPADSTNSTSTTASQ